MIAASDTEPGQVMCHSCFPSRSFTGWSVGEDFTRSKPVGGMNIGAAAGGTESGCTCNALAGFDTVVADFGVVAGRCGDGV